MYADERKDKMTVREQVETTVDCGGDLLTATTTVQKQVQREHCPFIAVNPEIKRIKTATLKDGIRYLLADPRPKSWDPTETDSEAGTSDFPSSPQKELDGENEGDHETETDKDYETDEE